MATGPLLFSELPIRGVVSKNRIMVSPMCQYAATDGMANDFHLVQAGRYALGGAGIVILEATAVEERGRISHEDLGLWRDDQIAPMKRIADFLRAYGAVPGVQLGHAGRKASTPAPWFGGGALTERDVARGNPPWPVVGPSAISPGSGWPIPHALVQAELDEIKAAWASSARRADEAGFDIVHFHGAHGYLLHSFLSPVSNTRIDCYGGSLENRIRYPLEVVRAVRAAWPSHKPLFYRLSVVDGIDGGWTEEESHVFCRALLDEGIDVIDCSSGGAIADRSSDSRIRRTYGFHAPYSARMRAATGGKVATVGFIVDGNQAEAILAAGEADIIAVGREFLSDPNWAHHARQQLTGEDFADWPREAGYWLGIRAPVLRRIRESGETPLDRYVDRQL